MEINWGWGGVYEKWLNFIMCDKSQNQPQLFAFWVVVANKIDYLDKAGFAAYPCVQVLTSDIHHCQSAKGYRKVSLNNVYWKVPLNNVPKPASPLQSSSPEINWRGVE